MERIIKITEEEQKALDKINSSFANIWSHPKGPRGGKEQMEDVCEYCGKYSKEGEGEYYHTLTSGLIIPMIDEGIVQSLYEKGLIDSESQGCFSIGSSCAKKLLGKRINEFK